MSALPPGVCKVNDACLHFHNSLFPTHFLLCNFRNIMYYLASTILVLPDDMLSSLVIITR